MREWRDGNSPRARKTARSARGSRPARVLVKTHRPFFNQTGGTLFCSLETPMSTKLTNEIITAAIAGFESQKTRIDQQISELKAMLSGGPAETAATPKPKRKKFSAAARRRMKDAQQRRWAKIRGESEPPVPAAKPEPRKSKRRISEEGMKRIVAASKKRWRLAKAAKAQTATAKKAAPAGKKAAVNKAAVKAVPAKAVKKSGPVKKAATKKVTAKKTAAAPTQTVTQAAGQYVDRPAIT
jgi:hypothetical protein